MGGCQNYGPLLGTLNIRGRLIIGTQKGTIILTTTHIAFEARAWVAMIEAPSTIKWARCLDIGELGTIAKIKKVKIISKYL